MNRQDYITRHQMVKDTPYIPEAWQFFLNDAMKNKVWALNVHPEWFKMACQVSLEMQKRYATQNVLEMAVSSYVYSYYRSGAKQGSVYIDPSSRKLWNQWGVA